MGPLDLSSLRLVSQSGEEVDIVQGLRRIARRRTAQLWQRAARFSLCAAMLIAWALASRFWPGLSTLLPGPGTVAETAWALIVNGSLPQDLLSSLTRVLVALAWASLVGFPLGFALGAVPCFAKVVGPVVNFLRPIPPIAWIPLSILWLGIGNGQKEFIIFLGAIFPIVLNTCQGVLSVDKTVLEAASVDGATDWHRAVHMQLPLAMPEMLVGLRIGTGIAWMALVAGEMVAASSGLGFLIMQGRMLFRPDIIVVGMVVIGAVGVMLDAVIRICSRRIDRHFGR